MRPNSVTVTARTATMFQRVSTFPQFGWTRLLDVFLVTLIFSLFG